MSNTQTNQFQPTLPARGATLPDCASKPFITFQPTLPARGATARCGKTCRPRTISTHAPRTGSDDKAREDVPVGNHFNPRSPHGERPGEATSRRRSRRFQPTLPARGATHLLICFRYNAADFNPRSPHGERRKHSSSLRKRRRISTHAPRTGSDIHRRTFERTARNFNPRSPHGERR